MGRLKYSFWIIPLFIIAFIVITVQASSQVKHSSSSVASLKIVADTGVLDPDMAGVTLLADYGTAQLFSVTNPAMVSLRQSIDQKRPKYFAIDDMDVIEINGHVVNTHNEARISTEQEITTAAGESLRLIQFVGPIKEAWLAAVQETGSEPIHYIANNAYLVWADENGRSQLSAMRSEAAFLQFEAPFQPYLKLSTDLVEAIAAVEKTAVIPIVVQMIQHEDQADSEAVIEDLLITQSTDWQPIMKFQTLTGTVRPEDVAVIANLPDVYWLGVQQNPVLMDEVQGQIVAGNVVITSTHSAMPTGPGYLAWLDSYGFSHNPADYPIVDITDDGIGNGNANSAAGDRTLRELGSLSNPSRLEYIGNCTNESNGGGVGGHGHINMSIAGGYDGRSGFPYQDDEEYQLGMGINPYGRFGGTRVFYFDYFFTNTRWDISGCGDGSFAALIKQNQDSGASIVNNSWGNTETDYYSDSAQAYDLGVRDADLEEPGNQELIYIFSAGNGGNFNTIGNPATAKNVITVGASENYRPYGVDGCAFGPARADDVMDIATFSSRGPAVGNRVKPELVAPGSHVQGTASTNTLFNGNRVCGAENNDGVLPADDAYYPLSQSLFTWSSGTSHAAPAVAGIASLYYYWLENTYQLDEPSPALMKAYLIGHPFYLTGALANDSLPSYTQGFGMPDMSLGLDDTPRLFVDQQMIFDNSGEQWQLKVVPADVSKPVRVVMAYTDSPGALGTRPQVNDLNLKVDTNAGTYLGNQFQGRWSVVGGSLDDQNNVEAVFIEPGEPGVLTLTVTGFNIAGDGVPGSGDGTDQDFALVCYNCVNVSFLDDIYLPIVFK